MLIAGSPWAGAARRRRSTRVTFLCARTEEGGGQLWWLRCEAREGGSSWGGAGCSGERRRLFIGRERRRSGRACGARAVGGNGGLEKNLGVATTARAGGVNGGRRSSGGVMGLVGQRRCGGLRAGRRRAAVMVALR
jgi:hypothetical protein